MREPGPPIFAQLVSMQIGTRGVMTPFADEAAFATAFRARFGHLDDEAVAQGPVDQSGYGDLELRDKYLSGIPSHVYRKIERATEVKQQLDISRARWPELNSFFSARGRGHGGARGGAP
ncbi:predicted protein [Postia placenta Mad-698-R]|nr:predicted protein [Postia placenta Mad-698-R]